MKHDVIFAKIENIRHCLKRIKDKTPSSVDILLEDYDLQDIISVNLERAIQSSVDLGAHALAAMDCKAPSTMAETFQKLKTVGILTPELAEHLSKAVGFRNISVHEYQSIDWHLVFAIITCHLDTFHDFIRQILKWQRETDCL